MHILNNWNVNHSTSEFPNVIFKNYFGLEKKKKDPLESLLMEGWGTFLWIYELEFHRLIYLDCV